ETTQWQCTYAYALSFYNLAVQHRPDVQVYIYETWDEIDLADWRDRIDRDRPIYEQYVLDLINHPPAQPVIRDPTMAGDCPLANPPTTREAGKDVLLIPAARAMKALDDAINAGTLPGITARQQLFADNIHPNDIGNYFVALVFYATLY